MELESGLGQGDESLTSAINLLCDLEQFTLHSQGLSVLICKMGGVLYSPSSPKS